MGTAATKAKRKYNDNNYDRLLLTVEKGKKERIKARADELGKSTNKYITDLITADMEKNS